MFLWIGDVCVHYKKSHLVYKHIIYTIYEFINGAQGVSKNIRTIL